MLLIRPVRPDDLAALERLAVESGPGMVNLPADRGILEQKIAASGASLAKAVAVPGDESNLLLLEDAASGALAGTSGIIATVGLTKPFYSFEIVHLAHTSQELNRYESVQVLQMVNEYRGATEIASLYLTPDYRRDRNGQFLSRVRFLFMAEFPQRFADLAMAEMRGVHDARGRSVFWDSLGRHFLHMDLTRADYLSSLGRHQFIADLMPKHPIYIRLLPKAAQDVIGVTHQATRPALELLKREGFRFEGYVDVFDAGPSVHAPLDQIRTVRESRRAVVGEVAAPADSQLFMISNARLAQFRACRGPLDALGDGTVRLGADTAAALEVGRGDMVRFVSL